MIRTTAVLVLLALLAVPCVAQDGRVAVEARPPAASGSSEKADDSTMLGAAELRERVQEMRKRVLGGGPAVERSEKEALRFYRKKIDELARKADDLRTTRDLKVTDYELALDGTLDASGPEERAGSARTANRLRAEIDETDAEIARLEKQADVLGHGVASIQKRAERRKSLLARMQGPEFYAEIPNLGDELVDFAGDEDAPEADPFLDSGFIDDLLRRDPDRGRELLFEHDPLQYWKRFPLAPPRSVRMALRFPAPDLPARR